MLEGEGKAVVSEEIAQGLAGLLASLDPVQDCRRLRETSSFSIA
jgi:hypothetical protein